MNIHSLSNFLNVGRLVLTRSSFVGLGKGDCRKISFKLNAKRGLFVCETR